MGILSADTSVEVERIQFEILRSRGVDGRLESLAESILDNWALTKAGDKQLAQKRWLGFEPPQELKESLIPMQPLQTPLRLAAILQTLGLKYVIGGSYASSLHGEPRATRDCDFLVALHPESLDALQQAVESEFYISRTAAEEALRMKRCFNLIHLKTGFKIDIFVSEGRDYDRERLGRALPIQLEGQTLSFSTAEDTILSKLEWSSTTPSEQQRRDVLAILMLQKGKLDLGYLRHWARELDVIKTLEELLLEVEKL